MTPNPCDRAVESLHRRLDGLEPSPPPAVRQHLHECPTCRQRYAAAELLRRPPARTIADPNRVRRITAAVRRDRDRRTTRRTVWVVAFAAAVVAALSGQLFWPTNPAPVPGVAVPLVDHGLAGASAVVHKLTTLPSPESVELPDSERWATALASAVGRFDPVRSFAEPGRAFVEGFEPVASGPLRAYQMFRRERSVAAKPEDSVQP